MSKNTVSPTPDPAASTTPGHLGQEGPRSGVMTITPEQASEMLATRNTRNRTISPSTVARYARDMAAGDWLLNGDAIRFAVDGTILDGQHRLAAIVKAGITVRTFVVWNLPLESQATMDDGRKRSMANVLQLDGKADHAKTVASILRRALLWERGYTDSHPSANPTKAEMTAYYEAHPDVFDSAVVADRIRGAKCGIRCAASTLGLAHHLFASIDRTQADDFFEQLRSGAGLAEGSPVLVLRNRLASDGSTRLSTENPEVLAWFIKAWNAYRAGKRLRILRHKANDAFPMPR